MPGDAFVLDVGSALAAPGVRHTYSMAGRLPEVELASARLAPEGDEVRANVVVEAHGNELVAEGSVSATWTGACRRCLGPTSGSIDLSFREVYAEDPVEGEMFPLVGEQIDLAPMLREALTLALPLAPLCTPDCPGPDPEAYPVGASDQDEPTDEPDAPGAESRVDDRWAALDDLHLDG